MAHIICLDIPLFGKIILLIYHSVPRSISLLSEKQTSPRPSPDRK